MESSNKSETSEQFKLKKSTYRVCWLLLHRNYVFHKNYENKDGSINSRCQNSRTKGQYKCSVTCRNINNVFIREPNVTEHNHAEAIFSYSVPIINQNTCNKLYDGTLMKFSTLVRSNFIKFTRFMLGYTTKCTSY